MQDVRACALAKDLFEIQSNGVEPHKSTIRAIFKIFLIFVVFVVRAAKICEICVTLIKN